MSDAFWKRLSMVFGFLSLASLFILLIFVANLEIKDLDLWLHIGMGRHIVSHGFQVPAVDILSCSIAGAPWVNHEWLFQIIVYFVHNLWGPDGLITMQVILVAMTMLILLFLGYNREKQLGSLFILLLVSLVYQGRFTIRPDLYSLLFFAAYILLLSFFLEKRWSVTALFLIQLLWTNMHGFFFFGPLFVLIGLTAEWIKRHVPLPYQWNTIGKLNNAEYRRLKVIFGFVLLACLCNPLGFEGAWYPLRVFFQISGESKIFFEKIIELKRPITWNTLFSMAHYPYYKLLIVLSFVSFVFNRRKIDIGVLMFWAAFLVFSLSAIRNLIFFAFAAYLAFVTNALTISLKDIIPLRITDKKFMHIASAGIKIFLMIWIVQYGAAISLNGYFDFDKYERKSEFGGVSLRSYPTRAVDFLVENKVKGNFFNDFNSGAYLVGRCSPDIKVFIDGRTEVYGPKFFKFYQKVWEKDNTEEFEKVLEKFKITGAFMNSVHQPIPKNILNFLYQSQEWIPVYFDYDAMIFLKSVPFNQDLIERFRIDLGHWEAKPMDLLRLGSKKVTPRPHMNRAFTLESIGLDEAALAETAQALKVSPKYREIYKMRGKIYAKRKDFQQAFENFRIAVTLGSGDRESRLNLARTLFDLEEYHYATEQYEKVADRWPNHPKAYFMMAKIFVKQDLTERAVSFLQKARKIAPDNEEITDMLKELQR